MGDRSGRVPALVIGVGLNALGVMRSLGREGIPLYNLNPLRDYVTSSRWYRPAPRRWGDLADNMPLAAYLARVPLHRAVLFAASDDRVQETADLPPALRARFSVSIASSASIRILLDKLALADFLRSRELPHPRTFVIRELADLEAAPTDVYENAFLKPRDSLTFNRRFGVKGYRVASREDATARLEKLEGHAMVLQEYIPGDASHHYFIDGFIDRHGTVNAMFARQRVRMYPHDFGNSSSMISIPLADVDGARQTLERLLHDLDYRGIFSAEFKRDPRDGVFKLLEVNCRSWWFNGFAADCGVDTTLMAYDDALDLPVPLLRGYRVGAKLVYSFNDFRAVRRLRQRKELKLRDALKFWAGASDALFRRDDPLPFLRYSLQQLQRSGKGILKRR